MDRPLSPDDLHIVMHEADAAARRLHRRLRLPAADLDDLRQDLLADLIARLPSYDRERGTLGAFAGIVMRHRAARITDQVARQRRNTAGTLLSLDEPIGGPDGPTYADLLSEADGLGGWHGQRTDPIDQIDRRLDVGRAMAGARARDRSLCAALAERSVDQLAAAGVGARTTLYRRVRELRMILAAEGLLPRWDAFRAA